MSVSVRVLVGASIVLVLAQCGGERREPASAGALPPPSFAAASVQPAAPVVPLPDASSTAVAEEANDGGAIAVVAALPATTKLARGSGSAADAALAAGDAAFEADDFGRADEKYREAAKLAPGDAAPLVGLARVAIAKTNVPTDYNAAPKNPAIEKAAAQLRQAVRLDPKFAPAQTELGRALLILGKAGDALGALRKAVELAPGDAEAHSAWGVALLATGRSEDALVELAKAAELDPGSAPRQTNLGTAFLMRGRVTDAVRAYEAATRIAPEDARTMSDLGTALLADNQIERAMRTLKRAVTLDPKRGTLHSNLGYALQQMRDYRGAIAEYREAIRLDEKLVSAWINLATALVHTGERAEAHKALERAQKLDPGDPRVRANVEELRDLEKKHPRDGGAIP